MEEPVHQPPWRPVAARPVVHTRKTVFTLNTLGTLGRHLVLLVDDDPAVREPLRALLEARRIDVASASSVEEALAILACGVRPDAILTDLSMPGRRGVELVEEVRRGPRGAEVPIVAMSGCAGTLAALDGAADAKLLKPIDLPRLLDVLGRLWREAAPEP